MPITKASSNAVAAAAKGDLVVGNATNDSGVLAVGSTNQVLTVDSSTATGLKWATPAAGGGMTLISTTTLSGSTTTISSIPQTYKHLYLVYAPFGGTGVGLRFNTSTQYYGFSYSVIAGSTFIDGSNGTGNDSFYMYGNGMRGTTWIPNYAGSDSKTHQSISHFDNKTILASGLWGDTVAITGLQFVASGTALSGKVYMYGVN
jgi:hypothetical protein